MKKLLSIIFISILLFSCERKMAEIDEQGHPTKNYEVINGNLHFISSDAFSMLADSLAKLDDESLALWEKKNKFHSLYSTINKAEEQICIDDTI